MAGDSMKGSGDSSTHEERQAGRQKLEKWLNKSMRIKMTDGRTLVGIFVCTDCDCNIIMGSCEEYLRPPDSEPKEDPRILGLAMIPGKHIVSIEIDDTTQTEDESVCTTRNNSNDTASSGLENDTSTSDRSAENDSSINNKSNTGDVL